MGTPIRANTAGTTLDAQIDGSAGGTATCTNGELAYLHLRMAPYGSALLGRRHTGIASATTTHETTRFCGMARQPVCCRDSTWYPTLWHRSKLTSMASAGYCSHRDWVRRYRA